MIWENDGGLDNNLKLDLARQTVAIIDCENWKICDVERLRKYYQYLESAKLPQAYVVQEKIRDLESG